MGSYVSEAVRIEETARIGALGLPIDRYLDGLAQDLRRISGCPFAAITVVGKDVQWFYGRSGLAAATMPREFAFCDYTIRYPIPLEVRDTTSDRRFRDNPFVTGTQSLRFYAGLPIVTRSGARIGAVCVLDTVRRSPLPDTVWRCLQSGARTALSAMEFRIAAPGVPLRLSARKRI